MNRTIKLWGGFVNGRLHKEQAHYAGVPYMQVAVFSSKRSARRQYQDVRPVHLRFPERNL